MSKFITSAILLALFFSIKTNTMGQEINDKEFALPDTSILIGKFVKHQFYNKAGRAIEGAFDKYFKTEENEYFVKRIHCKFPEGELRDNFDILFEVKAIKTFGLWDADDNTVQSRVGEYVEIYEILKK